MTRTTLPGARLVLMAGALALAGGAAGGQAVETHPAPILHGPATARLDAAALLRGSEDARPFGVDLSGLMLVDAHQGGAALPKSGAGIDVSHAGAVAQGAGLAARLRPFLGQPLSYKLIAEIEAAVTQHYRESGRALVLVTVPPQEITSGVLQVNVNTFRLEGTEVAGAPGGYVQSQIRQHPGEEVDTGRLMEDVAWLNLNPFRHVAVAFQPGATPDGTRLTLQVEQRRPWSAYLGASNGGSEDTGTARIFGGFNLSALSWQDHQLSWQTNASPSALSAGLWDMGSEKGYVSHALGYFVPVTLPGGFRFKATFGLSHVSSHAVPDATFATDTTTDGATLELAVPLRRVTGTWSLLPEAYLGLATSSYDRQQYFGGTLFDSEATRLTSVELGLRSSLNGRLMGRPTHGGFDVSVVTGRQETDGTTTRFTFAKASIGQEIGLERDRQLALRLSGQAGDAVHALYQAGLGGEATVRGYPSNAASGSRAASLAVEYRLTPMDLDLAGQGAKLRPHAFADWGVVGGSEGAHLAAIGLGGSLEMGEALSAQLDLAKALTDAGTVEAGETSIALRLIAKF